MDVGTIITVAEKILRVTLWEKSFFFEEAEKDFINFISVTFIIY